MNQIIFTGIPTDIQSIQVTIVLQWDKMDRCRENSLQTQAFQFELIIIIILMVRKKIIFKQDWNADTLEKKNSLKWTHVNFFVYFHSFFTL